MKKLAAVLVLAVTLSGCLGAESELERGMELRSKLLAAENCSFETVVTADYGDRTCSFTLDCRGDEKGNVEFTTLLPESVSGITGKIGDSRGQFTFDGTALDFPLVADGLLSPISAPWILLKALRGGYISSAATEKELLHLSLDDSYKEDELLLDVWLDENNMPVRGEILHEGQRYLTMEVKNFRIE